jgi:hypothetical protein
MIKIYKFSVHVMDKEVYTGEVEAGNLKEAREIIETAIEIDISPEK